MGDRQVPSMLKVEEAADFLRIGRTKAYALAQEWRATGGQSGLPVVDFGHVLRVPRCQLEALIGGPLGLSGDDVTIESATSDPEPAAPLVVEPEGVNGAAVDPAAVEPAAPSRGRTRRVTTNDHRDSNTQLSFSELHLND